MGTEIKAWLLNGEKPQLLTDLSLGDHKEQELEDWIVAAPEIITDGIAIIGRQVKTDAGFIDLLGIDAERNVVVIELKKDRLARDAIAQAIDYASAVKSWAPQRFEEICEEFRKQTATTYLATLPAFQESSENPISAENIRIILVGLGIDSATERMIHWLAGALRCRSMQCS